MKNLLLSVLAISLAFIANAQRIGVQAGYSHSRTEGLYQGAEIVWFQPGNSNGVFVGINFEVPGNKLFSFMTDPAYSWERNNTAKADVGYRYWSVNVPANFQFNIRFSEKCKGFLFAGMYGEYYSYNLKISNSTEYSSYNVALGVDAGLGVEVAKHLKIFGKYGFPVTNSQRTDGSTNSVNYKRIQAGLAYMF